MFLIIGHSSRDEPIKKSPQAARADIQQVKDRSIASEQKPFDKQLKPPQMTQQQPNPSQQSKPSQPSHGPLAQTQHDKPEKRQESSQKVQHDKFNQREQKQSSDSGSSQQAQRPSQHLFAEGPGKYHFFSTSFLDGFFSTQISVTHLTSS